MKCHSWRLESETGAAWKVGLGLADEAESSAVSFSSRRIVGEGAMARWSSSRRGLRIAKGQIGICPLSQSSMPSAGNGVFI